MCFYVFSFGNVTAALTEDRKWNNFKSCYEKSMKCDGMIDKTYEGATWQMLSSIMYLPTSHHSRENFDVAVNINAFEGFSNIV